jgi:hypothetical protein
VVVEQGVTGDGRSFRRLVGELPIEVTNIIGLDLGERVDYTALVHVERRQRARDPISGQQDPARYDVQRLRRWRDVAATTIRDEVAERLTAWGMTMRDSLVLDWTGAGIPVLAMYAEARLPITLSGIYITSSGEPTRVPGGWHVSKRDLVAALMIVLEQRRLDIPDDLPEARTLKHELGNFRVKMTKAGNERYEAWRDGDHDDLVLATAMVCWYGEQPRRETYVY